MLTPEEFCFRVRIEHTTLELWLDQGWLVPREESAGLLLSEIDLARAQLIRDLREDMGVNDEGIGIILDLIDQVHGLRSVVKDLLGRLGSTEALAGT